MGDEVFFFRYQKASLVHMQRALYWRPRLLLVLPTTKQEDTMGCFIRRQSEGDVEATVWRFCMVCMDLGKGISFRCDGKKKQITVGFNCFHLSFVVRIFGGSFCFGCAKIRSVPQGSNIATLKNNSQHHSNRWTDAHLCFAPVRKSKETCQDDRSKQTGLLYLPI